VQIGDPQVIALLFTLNVHNLPDTLSRILGAGTIAHCGSSCRQDSASILLERPSLQVDAGCLEGVGNRFEGLGALELLETDDVRLQLTVTGGHPVEDGGDRCTWVIRGKGDALEPKDVMAEDTHSLDSLSSD